MTAQDTPQTPTDGKVSAAAAPVETKAPVAPATDAKEQPQSAETTAPAAVEEKPLPGLSVEKPAEKAKEARPGSPEKFEWKIEGDPKFVEGVTKKLEPMARSLGLSNDEIHGVYDTFSGLMRDNSKAMFKQWASTLEQDKDIGGDKLEESLAQANSVVSQYGDDELRGLLDKAGLRHNPAIVRLLVNVARDVGGDRMPRSLAHESRRATPAGAFDYPSMK